ncbi:methylase of polypeptide subunit release factors [Friedmanniella endophytica]|uniref:Methylase of polypeptide subunit release factors n=1 Tax=Microlunatus kandeliicorticis TaxID=1759536 RepID=A0A7W3IRP7_9ACTN|nr:methyltransferase [Microlunatus kandeliicorticis]MBA8794017.1 methylase of polypeptide subunit release factors [Microlunatus kandeliicorticis]
MLSAGRIEELAGRLDAVGYRVDAVLEALGPAAHAALGRNQTVPGERALAGRDDPLATLVRLFPLQLDVDRAAFDAALPGWFDDLAGIELITADAAGRVRALSDLRPYAADDGVDGWVFSDLTPGLDGGPPVLRPDYVLGVSPASISLAQLTIRDRVGTALDLGTGCGVQGLHLVRHADRVVGTDVNARALAMAALTARINGAELDLRAGDLYQPVAGEQFDLIVTNPPFVMAPPGPADGRLTYREAGLTGDELMRRVVVEGAARLAPDGVLQVLGNWAHPDDDAGSEQGWQRRLRGWIEPTGCDAHVIQRERLDVEQYVEIWLTDAGLAGTDGYRAAFGRWCDYFAALGIGAVGMGWVTLVRAGRDAPVITLEDWPHAVEHPIGPALGRRRHAVDLERSLSDEALLAGRWRLAEDVTEESFSRPGSADPYAVVLRQQRGLRRAHQAGTGIAGVLGACDGELRLAELVAAVAGIIDVEERALSAETVPVVRQLILDGMISS